MKKNVCYFIAFWMIGILFNACDSPMEPKNQVLPEVEIIQELPRMYLTVIPIEDTRVINDVTAFNAIFSASDIEQYKELANINWDTQTLLIGRSCHTNGVKILDSSFKKNDEFSYCYRIEFENTDSLGIDDFIYGTVVEKIPMYANVIFDYRRFDPESINKLWKKDLPKMRNLKAIPVGDKRVINDAVTFNSLFSASDIEQYKELADIDWDTQTLLIGRSFHPNQVNILEHVFKKQGKNSYRYQIKIQETMATAIDDFIYGIIIKKLATDADVIFEYSICNDLEPGDEFWPEAKIIKELPQMYLTAIPIGSTHVINDENTFNSLFSTSDIEKYSELREIDWSTQTLLVGQSSHTNLVNILGHTFKRADEHTYHYRIDIQNTDALAIDNFMYGIVVKKLPLIAKVVFEYYIDDPDYGERLWSKELPKMRDLMSIPVGDTRVINDAATFNAVFSAADIEQYRELAEIDWNTQTLLIGRSFHPTQVNIKDQRLERHGKNLYRYRIKIQVTGAEAIDDFIYGIIVEKLSRDADVIFDYHILPSFW